MHAEGIIKGIKVNARQELKLTSGDLIDVNIIKRVTGNKWAIGLKGKIYPAISDIELKAGEKIKVLVHRSGNKYILKLKDSTDNSLTDNILKQTGDTDLLSRLIISTLLRSKAQITPEIINMLRGIMLKYKIKNRKLIRSLAILLDKQIDLGTEGIYSLINMLNYEQGDHRKREKQENMPKDTKNIKNAIKKRALAQVDKENHPIQLFNHLKGINETWIVIPYNFLVDESNYFGTIKILYEPFQNKVIKLILEVKSDFGDEWSFFLKPKEDKINLSLFCDKYELKNKLTKKIEQLKSKLQNCNVECDDNIYNRSIFDGFSPVWEEYSYHGVNTLT